MTLSTHVLDTVRGVPATDVAVQLFRRADDGWQAAGSGATTEDGRLTIPPPVLAGVYRLRFDTGCYFDRTGERAFYPEVIVTFEITDPDAHHHVPLLLSPFGYSTYRGS